MKRSVKNNNNLEMQKITALSLHIADTIKAINNINEIKKPTKMKTRITAAAPTAYQIKSLSAFGLSVKKNLDGSFTAEEEFASYEEAKKYLIQKANDWYNSHNTTEDELNEMFSDIEIYGNLTLDAVTASIEKFNR